MAGFQVVSEWFQVISADFRWFQMVSGGFRWCQVVPRFSKYVQNKHEHELFQQYFLDFAHI